MKVILVLSILIFQLILSEVNATNLKERIDVKCHVVLVGGGETIQIANIRKDDYETYIQELSTSKIIARGYTDKVSVYKIKECALASQKFKSSKSASIEKDIVR